MIEADHNQTARRTFLAGSAAGAAFALSGCVTTVRARGQEPVLQGVLARPGSEEYRQATYAWNASVRHSPPLVVIANGAEDVAAAFRYAAANGLPVGVNSAGHGAVASIDRGILVSTQRLKKIEIDPVTRLATVGAGVKWGEALEAAQPYGLLGLGGSSPDVGVVGYTVGGGMPIMGRKFGFAADRVKSFEVVTPDGVIRHVDAASEPDLFWGLCGGSGNLGIVTEMTFEMIHMPSIYGGGIFYDGRDASAVMHRYVAWAESLPEEMCTSIAIIWMPDSEDVPPPMRGKPVTHLRIAYAGTRAEGEPLLAPMRAVAPALLDAVADMPYAHSGSIHRDPHLPIPFYHSGVLFREVNGDTVDALLGACGPDTNIPMILWELRQLGGGFARGPAAGNAVGGRDAAWGISIVGLNTPQTAAAVAEGLGRVVRALAPWSTGGTAINLHGMIGNEADRARAWDDATYQRLVTLVHRYDPKGLMRFGHVVGRNAGG